MMVVDSDEERWAQIDANGCSRGAAPGSSSLAMELMARPEELRSPECGISSVRHATRERASSGGAPMSARVEERRRKLPSQKGHDRSRESGEGLKVAGVGLPARHYAKASGSGRWFRRTMKLGRKLVDWWVS
jgi:hypothetical protein